MHYIWYHILGSTCRPNEVGHTWVAWARYLAWWAPSRFTKPTTHASLLPLLIKTLKFQSFSASTSQNSFKPMTKSVLLITAMMLWDILAHSVIGTCQCHKCGTSWYYKFLCFIGFKFKNKVFDVFCQSTIDILLISLFS